MTPCLCLWDAACQAERGRLLLKCLLLSQAPTIEHRPTLARLEALENDNAAAGTIEVNDDHDASLDDDDDQAYTQKRQSKSTKRKTRQAKALENAKKAPRTFVELLHEANLESLPPHVPSYLRAAVGPPSVAFALYVGSLPTIHV